MIKAISVLLFFMCACIAAAASAQLATTVNRASATGSAKENNVIIVNGKKFFMLQNARHFTGSANSPSALNVMHHPRPTTFVSSTPRIIPAKPSAITQTATTATATKSQSLSDEILSIFSPGEKSTPSTPLTPAPTK